MANITDNSVLAETFWQAEGEQIWAKRAVLVILGIAALTICSKIKFYFGGPVPVNLGTFGVLAIGAAYGPRLGLFTVFAYLCVGALGFEVFAADGKSGLAYMMGGTGGYLVGYVVAAAILGYFARLGWDRSVVRMGIAMVLGNIAIYALGLLWLSTFAESWSQTLAWGLWPFLAGDALKIILAAVALPTLWRFIGKARA